MLYLDTETYSATPITNGTYRYTADCEVMLVTYAFDDEPVTCWDVGCEPMPTPLREYLKGDGLITAHNAMFDRNVLKYALGIDVAIPRWRDTMVQALAHALPGGLAALCEVLQISEGGKKEGKSLINLFCKPRPDKSILRRATRETHLVEWQQFVDYAKADVEATRQVAARLPTWNYGGVELDLWFLDQRINDRGFAVDVDLATAALAAVDTAQQSLRAQTMESTAGVVASATQRDVMLGYILESYGVSLPDMTKSTLERRIADPDLPEGLRELLRIRLQACTTSTSKYTALLKAVSDDNRLRGTLQFNGASRTMRASGRVFQPQNLPSRGLLSEEDTAFGIEAMKAGCADLVVGDVMKLASSAIRGCIIAPPGKKLVVADLANIEGRDAAWLAGEAWKLQAFRDYDAGTGPDLYKLAYAKAFGVPIEKVSKDQRSIGKVLELFMQFGGGAGAFVTGAAGYGIDLEDMAKNAWATLPRDVVTEAEGFLKWMEKKDHNFSAMKSYGLSDKAFITCDVFKRLWRYANPAIASVWNQLEEATRDAIAQPGSTIECRAFKVRRDGAWLRIRRPSGRYLCYAVADVDKNGQISYMGNNQYTRKWQRLTTFGGKLFENCLTADTEVLTLKGWKTIVRVSNADKVWDGVSWASCRGAKLMGHRAVIDFGGVGITPEHEVLVDGVFTQAGRTDHRAATSSFQRHNRLPSGDVGGCSLPWYKRARIYLARAMRLRSGKTYGGEGVKKKDSFLLRVQQVPTDRAKEYDPRDVKASGLRGVALYARPLPVAHAPCMAQLRRAGYLGMRTLVGLPLLLGRYGAFVPKGTYARAQGQYVGVLCRELYLGHPDGPSAKHAKERHDRHAVRPNALVEGARVVWSWAHHATLSKIRRVFSRGDVRPSRFREEAVYDVINAGPRHRFTVRGSDGRPFIVHNCCQSVARDVLYDSMPIAEAAGYQIVLHVHDELVCETPDTPEYNVTGLSAILSTPPPWCEDMPLAAAGFETYRYKK